MGYWRVCGLYVLQLFFFSLKDTSVVCLCWGEDFIVTRIVASDNVYRAFCPSSLEEISLSGLYVLWADQCMLPLLFKGYLCFKSFHVGRTVLPALESDFLLFPCRSSGFRGHKMKHTCTSVLRLTCFLSSGKILKSLFLVKLWPLFGLAVSWQRQDPYCYLHACLGWILWLVSLPAALCMAAWHLGFFLFPA